MSNSLRSNSIINRNNNNININRRSSNNNSNKVGNKECFEGTPVDSINAVIAVATRLTLRITIRAMCSITINRDAICIRISPTDPTKTTADMPMGEIISIHRT